MDISIHLKPTDTVEAELLGICLRHPQVIDEVALRLSTEDWRTDAHQKLWRLLLEMRTATKDISVVTVADELHRRGWLDDVGGPHTLGKIYAEGPTAQPALGLANRVRDYSILRQLQRAGRTITGSAEHPTGSAEELLAAAEKCILSIAQGGQTGAAVAIQEVLDGTLERLDSRANGSGPKGISTGLTLLDELTGGFQPGELSLVAARPSLGKTSLGLAFARHAALEVQVPTLFVSLEQSAADLCERLLASIAGVDGRFLRRGDINAQEQQRLLTAATMIRDCLLWIDDAPSQNMTRIAATARRLKRQQRLGLIVIDYLQLIEPDNRKEPRHEQVARVSNRLKQLARDLEIPVVALAQLNRALDGRVSRKPRLSDLRESGQLEQDADTVLLLHRPDDEDQGRGNQIEVNVAKQRNGPTGEVLLDYQRHLYRFADVPQEPSW